MFEITCLDKEKFEYYQENGYVYKNGKYDFTFEKRFLIYHCVLANSLVYIAFDMQTKLSSEVTRKYNRSPYSKSEYCTLIPKILSSIKYTGDKRHVSLAAEDPMEVIESIFKTVLPRYKYKVREEQIRLSKNMYKAMIGKKVGICEAEVGTGKTLAYLIAAIVARTQLPRRKQVRPITIATSSIELQRSIIEKDIPILSDILLDSGIIKRPINAVLRKGKEHYMCLSRCRNFYASINKHREKFGKLIEYFKKAKVLETGFDLDAIALPPSVKERICVKGSCSKCPMAEGCRYARFKLACSLSNIMDIQVTNHNLYLASRKNTSSDLLRTSSLVIIDEAHKFKDAALDIFGVRLSLSELKMLERIMTDAVNKKDEKKPYKKTLKAFRTNAEQLFHMLEKYAVEEDDGEDEDEEKRVLIELAASEKNLIHNLISFIKIFDKLKPELPFEHRNICSFMVDKLKMFVRSFDLNVWVEINENGQTELCAAPANIGDILDKKVWSTGATHILTSGTMSDGESFEFFKQENGLSNISDTDIFESTTPSPFNYKDHTRLYIPKNLPIPDDTDEYYDAIAKHVVALVKATNGHTAVLFTSYKSLMAVYERTKNKLIDYEIFKMTKGSSSVIEDFKKSNNGVIFASGSMWEGVDCAGDCLSSVIIVRLPFPIRSASMEQKKLSCENKAYFISRFAVPNMVIKLRQGAGRLIRTENDTGIIAILDSRANRSSYATKVQDVMRKYPIASSLKDVSRFMHGIKGSAYFANESSQKGVK